MSECNCGTIVPCFHAELSSARAEAASLRERLATFGCVRCPDEDDNDLAQGYCPKHGEKLRDRNDELEAELTRLAGHQCDSQVLPYHERNGLLLKAAERVTTAEARATAAEGERDRLRELVERNWHARSCRCDDCRDKLKLLRALAAIPHTEGEASAPPADEVKRG